MSSKAKLDDPFGEDDPKYTWLLYITIGASLFVTLVTIAVLYDACVRYREFRDRQITDGGPPASPDHHYGYTISVKVDECSTSFDYKQSVLRVDFLDGQYQYLTSVALPCYVLRFKNQPKSEEQQQLAGQGSPINQRYQMAPLGSPNKPSTAIDANYKSLSHMVESWGSGPRQSQLVFYLVRRNELKNLSAVRVWHDCYQPNAVITIKHIMIRDEQTHNCLRVDMRGAPIRSLHPCPPSSLQVFAADKVPSSTPVEEVKSFIQMATVTELMVLIFIYMEIVIALDLLGFDLINRITSLKTAVAVGAVAGAAGSAVMSLLYFFYILPRRSSQAAFKCQTSTFLLLVYVVGATCLLGYAVNKLVAVRASYSSALQFGVFLAVSSLISVAALMLAMTLATYILAQIKYTQLDPDEVMSQGYEIPPAKGQDETPQNIFEDV